jgi:SNF2 family DNA or RNA helicase
MRQAIMATYLNNFTTQRKRKDVMPWLPPKDYLKVRLPCTPLQKKYLNELQEYFETEDLITQTVLDRMIRERQICVSPQIVDLKGSSPKIEWILDYIKDYPDKKILIFSKFKKGIYLLHETLSEKKIKGQVITGEVQPAARAELVKQFQQGDLQYLVLQIDACKEGLTLDNADVEIFLDAYPPAADVQQAEDRFVATTEDKKDKSHQIIQLMLEGTYDEECYNLVERRASSIDCINSYINYIKNGR